MHKFIAGLTLVILSVIAVSLAATPPVVTFQKAEGRVDVAIGGKPFTSYYHANDLPRPFFHPLRAADGRVMTRAYPMDQNAPGEEGDRDHPHHRSCWFTHGDVNGVDYWSEGAKRQGKIVVTNLDKLQNGPVGILATTAAWIDDTGHKVLDQKEEVRIKGDDKRRIMDFTITLTPTDKDVTFGDTKEGSFSVRLATPLKETNGGVIINSEGATGMKGCWGKKAKWVDYSGTLAGSKVGLTMMDHPGNLRYPTTWHVRDYGLFAANPFGLHDFLNDPKVNASYTVKVGQQLVFRYRILIHPGDSLAAGVSQEYERYLKEVR